jgi:hypothetical protein
MKAISLQQPFASLLTIGAKTIETRPWPTSYRGPMIIHAQSLSESVTDPYFKSILASHGLDCEKLPTERIIGLATLIDCRKIEKQMIPCYPQLAFSDFKPGWYLYEFANIIRLKKTVPAEGAAHLWEWQENIRLSG